MNFNELKRDIEKIVESVAEQIKSKNTNDDNKVENENIVNNVVVESKVTNENSIENSNEIENVVSESETLKIDSETVSEREKVICCNEVVISVDELKKEWRESS